MDKSPGHNEKATKMTDGTLFLYVLVAILAVFLLLGRKSGRNKKSRHRNNIEKGERVLKKIASFEHNGQKINYLRKVDPFVFEELLLSAFEKKGYRAVRNKRYTGDGGIDGIVFDGENNKILIQAKRYSKHIDRGHLKDFEGIVIREGAEKGYFVHTGRTSAETRKMFCSSKIELMGGDKLIKLITNA